MDNAITFGVYTDFMAANSVARLSIPADQVNYDADLAEGSSDIKPATESAPDAGWFLYFIRTRHNTLYCGVTTNVIRRFREHNSGSVRAARALRGKAPLQLDFSWLLPSKSVALKVEYRAKRLSRPQKERLIAGDRALQQRLLHDVA
ncbi:GIY-YIG nuclease family protein [Candidatus Thalassolituus haligoni]|uniref:GIY-YIG nuclease family protein n=1 Tax=Candidatus Thalassolituus haligoni TaxID=3100113 RepID=UPI0035161288